MNPQLKRILIVEDHQDSRMALALLFRRVGYEVATAATKAEAHRLCDENDFDVMVGDLTLPDGSGLDLMRELAQKCGIKGIAYTGNDADVAEVLAAGFKRQLIKPTDFNILFKTVEQVVAGV